MTVHLAPRASIRLVAGGIEVAPDEDELEDDELPPLELELDEDEDEDVWHVATTEHVCPLPDNVPVNGVWATAVPMSKRASNPFINVPQ